MVPAGSSQSGLLAEIVSSLTAMPADKRAKVMEQAAKVKASMPWLPNPGPQTDAYFSRADVLLYGGQGGGGKSDLGLGLALTAHSRSLILRRKYANLSSLMERAIEINGTRDGFNGSPPPVLRTTDGRFIQFAGSQHLGDEQDWQGHPFDLKVFDEATQFLELQVRFHLGWVRSTDERQRTRAVLASNPPLDSSGDWVIGMFRPWLDVTHSKPAKTGELRWFVRTPDGIDMEVDGPEPIQFPGAKDPAIPQSRTFIPAALKDNPYLINTGYQAQLDALPEPYRSAVRDGNFMAGRTDAENQTIPTQWILEAQARWTERPPPGVPMTAIGVDPAAGGMDETVLAPRHDWWFAAPIVVPGAKTPFGADVAALVVANRRDGADIIIDMGGGFGTATFEHLTENGITCHAHKGAEAAAGRTSDKKLSFTNRRSQVYWKFREALDPSQSGGSPIALPPDPMLMADLTAPTFRVESRGIALETKEKVVAKLGRSPDRGDAVVMAWGYGEKNVLPGQYAAPGTKHGRTPKVILGHRAAKRRR